MCKFSESSKRKLGNVVLFIASKAKYPYKTEILKILFLMEQQMVERFHVPLLGLPYSVWRLGPVSIDVFEELSDGPLLLADYISISNTKLGRRVDALKDFDEEEFSEAELQVMKEVLDKFGSMNSEMLITEVHKEGSLWYETAKEKGVLDDFDNKLANVSPFAIDMGRNLCPDDKEFYNETLSIRELANLSRL